MMNDIKEYILIDDFSYSKYVQYLKKKYGKVDGNYYLDIECTKKNKLIRWYKDEGLYIHHVKENKGHFLSKHEQAILFPFEYQLAKNLVYCNII